jgi:hypothetical protein
VSDGVLLRKLSGSIVVVGLSRNPLYPTKA